MNWESLYLVCFGVGLALSVLSFAGGFGHLHLGHLSLAHHTHTGGRVHSHAVSPFNLLTVMAFLCWFGGAGYLLTRYRFAVVPVIFALAVGVGLLGGGVVFTFLSKVLLPRERTMLPADTDMRGVIATVTSDLTPNHLGEILFSLDGTRRGTAARSEDGQPIFRNAQVLVMRYEKGIAYVRPFTDLDELDTHNSAGFTPT